MASGEELANIGSEGLPHGAGGAGSFVFGATEFILEFLKARLDAVEQVFLLLLGEDERAGDDDARLPGGAGRGSGEFIRDDLGLC